MVTSLPDWEEYDTPETLQTQAKAPKQQFASQETEEKQENAKETNWEDFPTPSTYQGEPDPTQDESWYGYLLRNVAANTSRIGEQVVGLPGNLEKFGAQANKELMDNPIMNAVSELLGMDKYMDLIKPQNEYNPLLPTSEDIKKFSIEKTGGYTAPKTKGEERFQSVVEDAASTLLTRKPTSAKKFAFNTFATPVAANVAKNLVEDTGFGDDKANKTKLAVWLALGLAGNVNGPQHASQLMNAGRNGIPDNLHIDVARYLRSLKQLDNNPHLLHVDPRSALARQAIANLYRDVENGNIQTRSLMTSYDGINALKRDKGLFDLNANDKKFAIKSIDLVRDAVKKEILESGRMYPMAMKNWQNGLGAWSAIHKSRQLTNAFDSLAKGRYGKMLGGASLPLFGGTAYAATKAPAVALAGAAAVPAAYKTIQTGIRVWSNPTLANYYWHAIHGLMEDNLPAFLNNYHKLNKALEKQEKKAD